MFFSSEGILAQNKILCTLRNLGQSRVHKTYSFLKVSLSRRSIKCFQVSEGSKSSTHYLSDTNRFDVSSKGPSSKRRICLYRLGSEWNFCCLRMLLSATYTGHVFKFVSRFAHLREIRVSNNISTTFFSSLPGVLP